MKRLFACALLLITCGTPVAFAQPSLDKYKDTGLSSMTNYLIDSGLIPMDKADPVMDYLKISECDIYKLVKDNPFKQQEIQQAIQKKISTHHAIDIQPLFIRIPSVIQVTGYNFDTQSLNIAPQSQIGRVNIIQLMDGNDTLCDNLPRSSINALALTYSAKLNVPVSLYRIPLKRSIAESVLPRLDKLAQKKEISLIYSVLYVQIEPIKPDMVGFGIRRSGVLHGQLNAIDLYADSRYKVLLKRLNYNDN